MDDQWQGYRGEVGLLSADAGTPVYYKVWNKVEIIFHIAPWMNEEQHRRLIGNDVGTLSSVALRSMLRLIGRLSRRADLL